MVPPIDQRENRFPTWLALVLLLVAGLSLRLWIIARTEVAARDSIGFIRTALRFEQEPWTDVVRSSEQPPGYALMVLVVSRPVRALAGNTSCDTMVFAAQLASALLGVLSIVPMMRLGRELGDRRLGWLAAGVMLALPGILRLTSDGLSEGTFLFFVSLTLWLGVRALRHPSALRMALCGVGVAAAYLTRPEGLELAVAAGGALVALQFTARRQKWLPMSGQLAGLACGVLVGVAPYVAITGHLTNKNTAKVLLGDPNADPARMLPYGQAGSRSLLGVWLQESGDSKGPRWIWAIQALASETAQSLQYFGTGLAVMGLFVWRYRRGSLGGRLLLGGLVALHVLILCRMASLSGYLSERHTLMLVIAACIPAAGALLWLGERLRPTAGALVAGAMLVVLIAAEMPSLAKPLHGNRAAHKAAGRFLAQAIAPGDKIVDPFNWAEFYAQAPLPPPAPQEPKRWFVVLESGDNSHSRLPALADARLMARYGALVFESSAGLSRNQRVQVFEVSRADIGLP